MHRRLHNINKLLYKSDVSYRMENVVCVVIGRNLFYNWSRGVYAKAKEYNAPEPLFPYL